MDETPEDEVPAGIRSRTRTVILSILVVAATIAALAVIIVPLATVPSTDRSRNAGDGGAPPAASPEPDGLDVAYRLPYGLGGAIRRVAGQTVALQCPVPDNAAAMTLGTGFLIAPDIVVSAAHVVTEKRVGTTVKAYCAGNGSPVPGTVIAIDELREVMVIRAPGCAAEPLAFDETLLRVNDPLHVAGFNFTRATASRYYGMTSPIPNASFTSRDAIGDPDVSQRVIAMERARVPRYRAIAGAADHGNSGSPVFTDEGKVVGMLVLRDPRHNRSFFVPAQTIRRVLSDAGIR